MHGPDKYAHVKLDGLELKPDEPWFLIRGQDKLAPNAIRAYANLLQGLGGEKWDEGVHIFEHADAVEEWQKAHPEYVKVPD